MPEIRGQSRADGANNGPAGPGAPAALFPSRLVHAIRVMLKMDPRVTDEQFWRRLLDDPTHRCIRKRMRLQDRLVPSEFGAESPVKTEDSPRRQPPPPKRMGILEAGDVEFSPAGRHAKGVQRAPVQARPRQRQMRTNRQCRWHLRFVAVLHPSVNVRAPLTLRLAPSRLSAKNAPPERESRVTCAPPGTRRRS